LSTQRAALGRVAEGEGFEPPRACAHTGFQDRRLQPLGHPSGAGIPRTSLRRPIEYSDDFSAPAGGRPSALASAGCQAPPVLGGTSPPCLPLDSDASLQLPKRERGLAAARADEPLELRVRLDHDGVPILALDTDQHGRGLTVARDDHAVSLGVGHAGLHPLLEVRARSPSSQDVLRPLPRALEPDRADVDDAFLGSGDVVEHPMGSDSQLLDRQNLGSRRDEVDQQLPVSTRIVA
jgi:hypothetical protein